MDAFEKCLRLGLKGGRERDIGPCAFGLLNAGKHPIGWNIRTHCYLFCSFIFQDYMDALEKCLDQI